MPDEKKSPPAMLPFIDIQAQYRRLKPQIDARIQRVLDHGRFILGPEVEELEKALSRFCGVQHTVTVSSGTEALRLPLMAEEIGPGDAVFIPAFTFTATAEVVVAQGAEPVFVDVEASTYNIDMRSLGDAVRAVREEGRLRPRCVMAVDLFGLPADYAALGEFCREEKLFLLSDACQSFGSTIGNRRVGTLAPVSATSFFPAKPLGCYGDGGAIFTDDAELASVYRSIRFHGAGGDRYDIVRLGTNARLDTIQAAVLLVKLEAFPEELIRRERAALRYDASLPRHIKRPPRQAGVLSAWAQYVIEVENRDRVQAALARSGIPTAIYYPKPLHHQTAYARYGRGPIPISEALCPRVLALPMHADLDDATIDCVVAAVDEATSAP